MGLGFALDWLSLGWLGLGDLGLPWIGLVWVCHGLGGLELAVDLLCLGLPGIVGFGLALDWLGLGLPWIRLAWVYLRTWVCLWLGLSMIGLSGLRFALG